MRVLVVWADDASTNLGVRALARGSTDLLSSVYPDATFVHLAYGSRIPQVPLGGLRPLLRERLTGRRGLMRWLAGFDLVWDTRAGDSFSDIYGMPRHMMMSLLHEFAVQAGVPVVLAPQTLGPFTTRRGRMLARRNLRRSSQVFARDDESAAASARLGRPVDAISTDLVFGIAQPAAARPRDVLLNVSGLLWGDNSHVDHVAYREAITTIIDRLLADGRSVTLLPHVLDSPLVDNDVPVSLALRDRYAGAIDVLIPDDLDDARAAIASSRVVIGARMHACLNALSTGTPAIAMAYSRKFRPLLSALGWSHVIDIDGAGSTIAESVLAAVHDPQLAEDALGAQREGQRRIHAMMVTLAATVPS